MSGSLSRARPTERRVGRSPDSRQASEERLSPPPTGGALSGARAAETSAAEGREGRRAVAVCVSLPLPPPHVTAFRAPPRCPLAMHSQARRTLQTVVRAGASVRVRPLSSGPPRVREYQTRRGGKANACARSRVCSSVQTRREGSASQGRELCPRGRRDTPLFCVVVCLSFGARAVGGVGAVKRGRRRRSQSRLAAALTHLRSTALCLVLHTRPRAAITRSRPPSAGLSKARTRLFFLLPSALSSSSRQSCRRARAAAPRSCWSGTTCRRRTRPSGSARWRQQQQKQQERGCEQQAHHHRQPARRSCCSARGNCLATGCCSPAA